jgi:hypothetical protein
MRTKRGRERTHLVTSQPGDGHQPLLSVQPPGASLRVGKDSKDGETPSGTDATDDDEPVGRASDVRSDPKVEVVRTERRERDSLLVSPTRESTVDTSDRVA